MLTFAEQSCLTWLEILEQLSDTENEVTLAKLTKIMGLRFDLYRMGKAVYQLLFTNSEEY